MNEPLKLELSRGRNLMPSFEVETRNFFNAIVKIDQPFLQKLVDMGALMIAGRDYFEIFAFQSMVMFKVRDGYVYIECLSTQSEARNQGSATKTMQAVIAAANATSTVLKLTTSNVGINNAAFAPPLTISMGTIKSNKIPVAKLKAFYEKFGFVVEKKLKQNEYEMVFTPSVTSETTAESTSN